jgi:dTDP-4-amino-4,6-dideoxygalactose transaminase
VGDLKLPETKKNSTHVFHIFAIRTKYRDTLQNFLLRNGIIALVHYPKPPYLQKACRDLGIKKGSFPIAEELSQTSLSLPIFPEMEDAQIDFVCSTIKRFFKS